MADTIELASPQETLDKLRVLGLELGLDPELLDIHIAACLGQAVIDGVVHGLFIRHPEYLDLYRDTLDLIASTH